MRRWMDSLGLSPAVLAVLGLAVLSVVVIAGGGRARSEGRSVMWTFAQHHASMYEPFIDRWNKANPPGVEVQLLSRPALERRMLSAFMTRTPVADLIEVERQPASSAFRGPLESVGFVDLTDRLTSEGLIEQFTPASLTPWTTRGRIFGLPHDVHPVMLGYRADVVEAAGIDVSSIETWEDYFRAMRPLMADKDQDGEPDHYPLSLWETHNDQIEVLMLQAGGGFIDESGKPVIRSEVNARTIASIVSWCVGPDAVATDVPEFSAGGNALKLRARAIGSFMPDWMCNVWRNELPQLAGKLKVMPLPAWERGGRRTSVWGGTMIGIPKASARPDEHWAFAKALYLSPEMARALYTVGDIVSPVKSLWSESIYDQPDPYFSGQAKGRMYINLAPQVPARTSSPYNTQAQLLVRDAVVSLADHARRTKTYTRDELVPTALELLGRAQRQIERDMSQNVFWGGEG